MRALTLGWLLKSTTSPSYLPALPYAARQALTRTRALILFTRASKLASTAPLLEELVSASLHFSRVDALSPDTLSAAAARVSAAALGVASVQPGGAAASSAAARDISVILRAAAALQVLIGTACAATGAAAHPIVHELDVSGLLERAAADVRALSREKFGSSPDIRVDSRLLGRESVVCVPSFLQFALTELLKNAAQSHVNAFSVAGLDDAPPLRIEARAGQHSLDITVEDSGRRPPATGFLAVGDTMRAPFAVGVGASSRRSVGEASEPTYYYSRDFGAPFSGAGLGLVRADVYARVHAGRVELRGSVRGTAATLSLQRDGTAFFEPRELVSVLVGT